MATIVCVNHGLSGTLYSSLELARRLTLAGHRLVFACFPEAREIVAGQGLELLPLAPSRYDQFLEADARASIVARLRHRGSRRRRAVESVAVDGFVEAVRRLAPDLLLIDGEMHEHVIAAAATGVPIVLLNTFASIWRRPGLPPPSHLARPGFGWKGTRLGTALLWSALKLKKRRRAWLHRVRRVGCDRLSVLRLLAADSGFDFRRETDDSQWLIPFTYRRLPTLSLHALEFEFPHRPAPGVHYVGPMLLESRTGDRVTDETRTALDAIFERRRAGDRKLIYAGFGSWFTAGADLLRRLLAAVAKHRDWELVVSLGGRAEPSELGRLPERAHAFRWLPQIDVLRHADVAVTHGGIHTIDECVIHRVPMLVYCGFETDMAGNTARVVHHGIGIAGDSRRDGSRAIREQIERLLCEPRFADNLGRLSDRYAAYAANRVAERTVESLLARGTADD